ncbi:MAG: RNA polymerase sigma factor [Ignavibacteriae bacterium]|nr:RNA polymerase sigma factor [Ignavibacteriota bacterium]
MTSNKTEIQNIRSAPNWDESVSFEIELLQKTAAKSEDAFEQLYERYSKVLFNTILLVVHERDEAEELLQDVFVQIWEKARSYDRRLSPPIAWLIRIARNKAIDFLRSKRFKSQSLETSMTEAEQITEHASHCNPDVAVIQRESSTVTRRALETLPIEQRVLVEKSYIEGYTHSELSKMFSLPLGTVKTRIRLGFIALQQTLLQYHDNGLHV